MATRVTLASTFGARGLRSSIACGAAALAATVAKHRQWICTASGVARNSAGTTVTAASEDT
ncbi:hypothetical protein P3T76_001268 [Phytophthora citrophthora]|uniref:Uncharacterized protein n=1 Tax=Phytophthora citrophthora TaxID=4793 RepID=A0AAD9LRU5_9STRA|nr:hypothetical protein P3T76_001268 [Phytophthora citrophthora]